jgi:sucrose-6-phosphate hydrolase SacC (GH32 family)
VHIDSITVEIPSATFILTVSFSKDDGESIIEMIDGTLKYNHQTGELSYNEYCVKLDNKIIDLQIISDTHSIEIFICKEKFIGVFNLEMHLVS